MHHVLMFAGILFSIISIFSFALGWEMWRDSLKNGSLSGMLEVSGPDIKLDYSPRLSLVELDGKPVRQISVDEGGGFIFQDIKPGQYLLKLEGRFIACQQKTLNVLPSRNNDLGRIKCSWDANQNWSSIFQHSQITNSITAADGSIWVTGFRTDKQSRNSYVVFRRKNEGSGWSDVIIPEISGAERASSLYQFETGEICLGTNGRGAVLSKDNGATWHPIDLGAGTSTISLITQLAGKEWLIVGRRLDVKYGKTPEDKPQSVIFISKNEGKDWNVISEHAGNIKAFIRHSSGRIIIGTDWLGGESGLFYSEDGAHSWVTANIDKNVILSGVGAIVELENGTLLAGTTTGYGKESPKGGRILTSKDGGKEWQLSAGDESWGNVGAITQLEAGHLLAAEGGNLIWSLDNGSSWFQFGKSNSYWVNGIRKDGSKVTVIGNSGMIQSDQNRLVLNFIGQ